MKISDIEMIVVSLPFEKEFKAGTLDITGESAVVPRITTDNGIQSEVFVGDEPYARVYPSEYQKTIQYVVDSFKDILIGEDPFRFERIWEKMSARTMTTMRYGKSRIDKKIVMQAIGAVDIALWDLIGKSLDQPIYRILGHYTDRIRVHGNSYYPTGDVIEGTRKQIKELKEMGVEGTQVKVAGLPIQQDVDRVKVVRETGGPDFLIDCDANQGWNLRDAIKFAKMVEDCNIAWLEEPIQWNDEQRGLKLLRTHTAIPICAGQERISIHEYIDLIDNDAVDYINPSPWKIGGVTPWMKLAHTAYAHGLSIYAYMSLGIGEQLMATIPNGLGLMVSRERHPLREMLWEDAPQPRGGYMDVPKGPGFGIKLKESTVQKLRAI